MIAPCCWVEPISVHRSDIAMQMRLDIEKSVAKGQTDQEILNHYKGIYGARILMEPEGTKRWLVYLTPALVAAAGLALVVFVIRRLLPKQTIGVPV